MVTLPEIADLYRGYFKQYFPKEHSVKGFCIWQGLAYSVANEDRHRWEKPDVREEEVIYLRTIVGRGADWETRRNLTFVQAEMAFNPKAPERPPLDMDTLEEDDMPNSIPNYAERYTLENPLLNPV